MIKTVCTHGIGTLPRIFHEAGCLLNWPGDGYAPMQLVAPSAVTIAVAMLAIIWIINLIVSFFVITHLLQLVHVAAATTWVAGLIAASGVTAGIAAVAAGVATG